MKHGFFLLLLMILYASAVSAAPPVFIEHSIGTTPSINNIEDAVVIDFDIDGDLDILTAAQGSDEITWWNNTGDNETFTDVLIQDNADTDGVDTITVIDFDGDLDYDIVYGARSENRIAWLNNSGDNTTFNDIQICESDADCDGVYDLEVIDIDADGDYDIVGAMHDDDEINLFTNDATNESFAVTTLLSGANLDQVRRINLTDYDGDGDYDLFYTAWAENRIAVGINDGSNTSFTDTQICESGAECDAPFGFEVIDMDFDGDFDVVATSRDDNQLYWFENDGTNTTFTRNLIGNTGNGGNLGRAQHVDVIDYDNDGNYDIAVTSNNADRLGVWLGDGSDTGFTETLVVDSGTTANGAFFIKAIDFDRDNDFDFVLSSLATDRLAIWETNESLPTLDNITGAATVGSAQTVNITANGEDDSFNETLSFYCDTTDQPTSSNTDCTGGITSGGVPYNLHCQYTAESNAGTYTRFCRVYDGYFYSSVSNISYTIDDEPPTISLVSVAGDTEASYFDTANDGTTEINVSGEANMACRWSNSDLAYSSMSNDCTISGTIASCSISDVASQGAHTRYISCEDETGVGTNASNNLDISFFLDYTAPTTSDNAENELQTPPYTVTISESDNVDSDPATLHCTDTSNTCLPSSSIDDGGSVVFTTANRGTNYLRFNSSDDAGNVQSVQSSTIHINQLPVFTSANDDATTIQGGATVNITSVSYDPDSASLGQNITLWVCNSTSISAAGCGHGHYCNVTGDGNQSSAGNLTCTFSAESDSTTHTWHAFLYDELGESASTTQSGSYTTDSTDPSITLLSPSNGSTITQTSVTVTFVTDESLSWAAYSLNGNANVTMSNNSAFEWTDQNTSIANGEYNLTFYANDSYNNLATSSGFTFTIDDTAGDTTAPTITIQSPVNNTYYTAAAVLLNISANEELGWVGYSNTSGELNDLGNLTGRVWNATVSFAEGMHNITFYANDTSSNMNQANKSIQIFVDLTNPAIDSFSCSPNPVNDSVDVRCNASASDGIGLDYVIIGHNATGSWQNSSQLDASGTSSNVSYLIDSGNSTPGEFTAEVYAYDLSGRLNETSSYQVTVSDDTFPTIWNITYLPNTTDEFDPGVRIDVNATIVEDYRISSVNLMYQNISSGVWSSIVMSNNSVISNGSSATVVYNASFTPQNGTWVFQINATDDAGNQNISSNTSLVITTDTSFSNSTNIATVKSFTFAQRAGNNSLGWIFVNNTGDTSFNFTLNVSSPLRSRFDINYTSDANATYELDSGESANLTVLVNTTDLGVNLYSYNLTIDTGFDESVFVRQLNIQTAAGPYLVVTVPTLSTTVTEGDSGVSYVARVENAGTADASGVYLNWSLPAGFTLASGSLSRNLGVLGVGLTGTNTITVDVDSSVSVSEVNLSALASAANADSANSTISISILQSDGSEVSSGGSSGSNGGGGGVSSNVGGRIESVAFSESIEIVRGEEETMFEIFVRPQYENTTLENLTLELRGFSEQYVQITPSKISRIIYGKEGTFRVILNAPSYKSYEEHELTAIIRGNLIRGNVVRAYRDTRTIKLVIQEISREEAREHLDKAREALESMIQRGFNTEAAQNLFEQAREKLTARRNKESFDLSSQVLLLSGRAVSVDNLIRAVALVLRNPLNVNILTGNLVSAVPEVFLSSPLEDILEGNSEIFSEEELKESRSFISAFAISEAVDAGPIEEMLGLAVAAFERGDYDLAEERAESARTSLLLELKGNFALFVLLYWKYILLVFMGISLIGVVSQRKYKQLTISRKIADLGEKEKNVRKLFNELQEKYFGGKISKEDYERRLKGYEKEIARILKDRGIFRNKRIKLLRPSRVRLDLAREFRELEGEIINLQKKFYKDKKIGEREYKEQFSSLQKRLAEIESEKAAVELLYRDGIIHKEKERKVMRNKREFFEKFGREIRHFLLKLRNRFRNNYGKKGIIMIDGGFIGKIKKRVENLDVKGKWIHLRKKDFSDEFGYEDEWRNGK